MSALNKSAMRSRVTLPPFLTRDVRKWRCRNVWSGSASNLVSRIRRVDLANPFLDRIVVRARNAQELNAIVAQLGHRVDDVVSGDCDVLAAWSLIELEILVDLRFLFPLGRLVERELNATVAVGDNLRHQR